MELVMDILAWIALLCLFATGVLGAAVLYESYIHRSIRKQNRYREFDFSGNRQFVVLMDAWNKHPMSTAGPEVDTRWFCPICGRHFPDVDGWHCPPIHYSYYHHDDDVRGMENPLWRI